MLSLARSYGQGPLFLKDIAKTEEISEKYLSLIIIPLRGIGLVISTRGAHGGYTLARSPEKITLKEIVDVLEGNCIVDCIKDPTACSRVETCASRDIWKLLEGRISETLEGITLQQLVAMNREKAEKNIAHNI
jgi:Rrf2 family protein